MQSEAQRWRENLFDCKLEKHKYGRKVQTVKAFLFSIGHLFTAVFKVVHY